jgi:hypothetical protein
MSQNLRHKQERGTGTRSARYFPQPLFLRHKLPLDSTETGKTRFRPATVVASRLRLRNDDRSSSLHAPFAPLAPFPSVDGVECGEVDGTP